MQEDMKTQENVDDPHDRGISINRRDFLRGLKKWSLAVIGGAVVGGALLSFEKDADAAGAWANRGGGGGAAWANRGGGGAVVAPGGGAWANRVGGGGAWANGGGGWINRGAAWVNGGGTWVNRF